MAITTDFPKVITLIKQQDPNRDDEKTCIYLETHAIKVEINKNKNLRVMTFDFHCPHLKSVWSKRVCLASPFERRVAEEKKSLVGAKTLNESDLPFGKKMSYFTGSIGLIKAILLFYKS